MMTDTITPARVIRHGLIDCFEERLTTEQGELANTEISAVVFSGFDNDRDPGEEDEALASSRNPHRGPYVIVELQ